MATTTITPTAHMPRKGLTRIVRVVGISLLVMLVLVPLTIPTFRRLIANPAGQPAVVGATEIEVRGDAFQNHLYAPSVVQVPVGSTVTWTFNDRGGNGNDELDEHNVVGNGWWSPVQTEGTFQHTFTEPGVYHYTCTLHAYMDGVVEVVE